MFAMGFKIHQHLVLLATLVFSLLSQGQNSVIQYEKALTQNRQIDISAVLHGTYSEIRWDKNGDGIVDSWSFAKDNISIKEKFENGKLREVRVRKKDPHTYTTLQYSVDRNFLLHLAKVTVRPYRKYFTEKDISVFAGMFGENPCNKPPILKYTDSSSWKDLICKTNEAGLKDELSKMVSPSCSREREKVLSGLNMTYGLRLESQMEENKVLNCLSKNQSTADFVPDYLQSIGADIFDQPKLQILCESYSGPGCGKASFDPTARVIKLPVKMPPCAAPMETIFGKFIFHESLHRVVLDELSEDGVEAIVQTCMDGNVSALDRVSAELKNDDSKGATFSVEGRAGTQNANRQLVESKYTMPANAQDIAQPANIIGSAGDRGGTLNSGFRDVASAASESFNPNQAYRESVARTGAVFPKFEAAVNAIVPPAIAASASATWVAADGGASGSTHSSGVGQWLVNSGPAAGSATVGVATQSADLGASNSKRLPSSVGESEASSVGSPGQAKLSASARGEVSGNSGRAVGIGRSASAMGGGSANVDLADAPSDQDLESNQQNKVALSPQQKQLASQLIQNINSAKNPNEVLAMLQKNDSKLENLKIHVYDPKAVSARQPANAKAGPRKSGYFGASEEEAAQFYSLINGKLVPE